MYFADIVLVKFVFYRNNFISVRNVSYIIFHSHLFLCVCVMFNNDYLRKEKERFREFEITHLMTKTLGKGELGTFELLKLVRVIRKWRQRQCCQYLMSSSVTQLLVSSAIVALECKTKMSYIVSTPESISSIISGKYQLIYNNMIVI